MSWSRAQILELGCLGSNLSTGVSQWSDSGQSASLPVPQFPHYEMGGWAARSWLAVVKVYWQ